MIPLSVGIELWRKHYGLTPEKAAMLLSTMPYNIDRAAAGTLHSVRAKILSERLVHVSSTMARCKCVIGHVRLKGPDNEVVDRRPPPTPGRQLDVGEDTRRGDDPRHIRA